MAAGSTIAAYAGLALAAGGTYQQSRAQSDQRRANRHNRAIARAEQQKAMTDQVREARIQRARAVNQAHISGGLGSTLSGATSSIGSQLGGNLGFSQSIFDRSVRADRSGRKAQGHMGRAGAFNAMSSVAGWAGDNFFQPQQPQPQGQFTPWDQQNNANPFGSGVSSLYTPR